MTDSSPNTTKDDHWVIVAPGVLALPTTGYVIRYEPSSGGNLFMVYHNDRRVSVGASLAHAKSEAARHMRDLIAIGLEP